MKVTLVGQRSPAYNTKNDIRDALQRLGHTVTHVDDGYGFKAVDVPQGDLLIYVPTHSHNIDFELAKAFKGFRGKTASIHFDLYWGIKRREISIGRRTFWKADYVFTADGGHDTRFKSRRVNHYWFPPPISERHIGLGTPKPRKYPAEIVFTGAKNHHAEWPYRTQLINLLEDIYGDRFRHYGQNAPYGAVWGRDLNDLYASAKVVVGDSMNPTYFQGYYWSNRVPEVLGRGGVLIHPFVRGMEEHGFIDKKNILYYRYGHFDSLKFLIDRYLERSNKNLRKKAIEVAQEHTYTKRMAEALKTMELA